MSRAESEGFALSGFPCRKSGHFEEGEDYRVSVK